MIDAIKLRVVVWLSSLSKLKGFNVADVIRGWLVAMPRAEQKGNKIAPQRLPLAGYLKVKTEF